MESLVRLLPPWKVPRTAVSNADGRDKALVFDALKMRTGWNYSDRRKNVKGPIEPVVWCTYKRLILSWRKYKCYTLLIMWTVTSQIHISVHVEGESLTLKYHLKTSSILPMKCCEVHLVPLYLDYFYFSQRLSLIPKISPTALTHSGKPEHEKKIPNLKVSLTLCLKVPDTNTLSFTAKVVMFWIFPSDATHFGFLQKQSRDAKLIAADCVLDGFPSSLMPLSSRG